MAQVADDRLTPSQVRAYSEVMDLCARAEPHLHRLRLAGVPLEQEEERIAHLKMACEAILSYEQERTQS